MTATLHDLGTSIRRPPTRANTDTQANRLLGAVPDAERRQILSAAELVKLAPGTVLYNLGDTVCYAYFPVSGLVSLFGMTPDGESLQVAAVGNGAMVGVPLVLDEDASPHYVVALVGCSAHRLSTASLRESCRRHQVFRRAILHAAHEHVVQIGTVALCHRFHSVLQRLSRWLIVYATGTRSDVVPLTQDLLAQVLGSPRTAVSRAALRLQDIGALRQRRGRMQILSRQALHACACECEPIPRM